MPMLEGLFGGGMPGKGAGMAGGAPMPAPKPGLMDRLGNPSWWGATLDNNPELPMGLMMTGQNMQDQAQANQPTPPPIPEHAMNNPQAVLALLRMIEQNMQNMERGAGGAPGFFGVARDTWGGNNDRVRRY